MNLLVLSTWFPHPPDNGSRLRAFHLLRPLCARYRVRLIAGRQSDQAEATSDAALRDLLGCESVASVPWRWYNAGADAGVFQAAKALLSSTPRSIRATDNADLRAAVAAHLAQLPPFDAVLALELGMAPFVPAALAARTVVDQVEVSGLEQARQNARGPRARLRRALTQNKAIRYWRRTLRPFAALSAVSEIESAAVRRVVGAENGAPPVMTIPNGVDVAAFGPETSASRRVPGRLLYNGALTYGPNHDAVCWFVDEILPRVAARVPEAHFVVSGRNEGVAGRDALLANPRVRLTGFVPDLRPVLDEAALCVVPLRQGGGTRLKILEAFASGLPVVSTTAGAAGIAAEHERHLLIADTPEAFANAVAHLLHHPEQAASLARNARLLVEAHYDWPAIAAHLGDLLEQVAAKKV